VYLEKLEIQGFKSFAKPATLVFNRDLTAIVGPNGSGKSNIADSVRWVLGEQSSKTLRGKKADDVIFAGSDKKGRLGFAQVDIYLNNIDKKADVDYDQIVVSRRVDRNGESEYLINNNKVRLLDIQLLLAKANFGQKTYSVIGQGMIDSILVSSATERKEFFDEATGVRQFQMKKEQSEHKLERSEENLAQSSQVLAELEPRLRSLTRQVKRLERRDELEKELHELQTDYYSVLSNSISGQLKKQRGEFEKLQSQAADLNQQLIELQTKLEKEEAGTSRQDKFSDLQNKLRHLQSELAVLLRDKAVADGQIDLALIKSGQMDSVWMKKSLENVKNEIKKYELDRQTKQRQLQVVQKDMQALEARQAGIVAEFKNLEEQLLDNKNGHIDQEMLSQKIDKLLKEQQNFLNILERIESLEQLAKLKERARLVTEQIRALWQDLKRGQHMDKQEWQKQFNKLLTSKDTLVSEIGNARTQVAVLNNEIEQLSALIYSKQNEQEKLMGSLKSFDKPSGQQGAASQTEALDKAIAEKNKSIVQVEQQIQEFNKVEEEQKQGLVSAQKQFRETQHNFNIKNNQLSEVKVELAKLETRQEELQREISEEIPDLKIKSSAKVNTDETHQCINQLKQQLHQIGGIDEAVMKEYTEVSERYHFLKEQSDDLIKAIEQLKKIIKDLDEAISDQFDKSFRAINKLFDKYFKKLFNGGKAELILNIKEVFDDLDENEETVAEGVETPAPKGQGKKQYGIDIKATPPGKKLSGINMLSGGEKALTSIALICAIIATNPSPFVVLDEVDAALDEANSVRFSEILDELSEKTQFIAITHNRATMHRAKIIYGVTMGGDGISRLLSMSFDQADELATK